MGKNYLDEEEKELMKAYDSVDMNFITPSTDEEQKDINQAAADFIKKEKKMNIRIDSYELQKIKEMAAQEGLRYQTFVKSVLHKYITGQLVDKKRTG